MSFLHDAAETAAKVASPILTASGLGALAPLAEMALNPSGGQRGVTAQGPKVGETQPGEAKPAAAAAAPHVAGPAAAPQATTPADDHFHSPYGGAFMSGIGTDQQGAVTSDVNINGRGPGYGYAAYAPSPTDTHAELAATVGPSFLNHTFTKDVTIPYAAMDRLGDVAAVTQYAAAADQSVKLEKGPDGKPQVNIDWKKLSNTPIEANYDFQTHGHDLPGAKQVNYDNPTKVAESGQKAIFDNLKASGKDPQDKSQFISITGHSGGGQSSFYTALKMASEGYKNVSVVGVDMAMTPHERQSLEALGVKVTNITSNNQDAKGEHTSEVGEFIKTGMGGGDNYYDLNVKRQQQTDPLGRHSIDNDANVTTMVRYAEYLDANGQHGNYSDANYQKFMHDNPNGNVLTPQGGQRQTADGNLMHEFEDNRNKSSGGQPRTEADFQKWFNGFTTAVGGQMLPLPDKDYGFGPVHVNPLQEASHGLGDLASSNPGALVGMLQQTGVDTSHIGGLEKYNGGNVSNHWGQLNPINVPLPGWLDIK